MHVSKRKAKRIYNSELPKSKFTKQDDYAKFFDWYISQWNLPSYFVTLTTQNEMSIKAARTMMHAYCMAIVRAGCDVRVMWCAEKFDLIDSYHLHALMCTKMPVPKAKEIWRNMNSTQRVDTQGKAVAAVYMNDDLKLAKALDDDNTSTQARTQFKKYKRGGGASGYCAKYITKSLADWCFEDYVNYGTQITTNAV